MPDTLAIWLYGMKVAVVEQDRRQLRLTYTEEALDRFSLGTPLLSLSLPLQPDRYTQGVVRPFLDGLLPEGTPRLAIAAEFDLRSSDTFALISELGRDCAGALVIQPEEEDPPRPPSTLTAEPLDDDALGDLVGNLRNAPLGADSRVRISLGGVQEKLVLTRMPDGRWGRPVEGTPSTHILKPELADYPKTVENEVFCMRLAHHLGLPVADVEMTTIAGRRLIVVSRYDRIVNVDGAVERIHQEDFCQVTATPPDRKYEEDGGPSLRRIAEILQTASGPDAVEVLLRATTLNVLVGNGDAHGKNFSLLLDPSGAVRFAPLYDVLATLVYGLDRLAMHIDDVRRTNRVTVERLLNEAVSWGMSRTRAASVVDEMLDHVVDAAQAARADVDDLRDDVFAVVESQLAQLRSSVSAATS